MDRRTLLAKLVAAGSLSALGACLHLEDDEVPTGDPDRRPDRQHAWNDHLPVDDHGNVRLPRHHAFLSLSYEGDDLQADRRTVEAALTDLERAYEVSGDGLLFTIGYSSSYFGRRLEDRDSTVDSADSTASKSVSPPEGVDLPPPGPLHDDEHVARDDADAFLHLASDHGSVVLTARHALLGDEAANGVDVTSLGGILRQQSRRTGFIGAGLPAEFDDNLLGIPEDAVDESAPTFMNFRSGFRANQATEKRVTIQSGRFAGGTIQHVEMIRLLLGEWYERSTEEQVARLFGTGVDAATVGDNGEELTDHNGVEPVEKSALSTVAAETGVVGHAQKLAHLREGDGRPPILRRDVNSRDNGEAGMVFVSLQRAFADFERVRLAMEGRDIAAETSVEKRRNNGILQYLRTRQRGNFLVPPRDLRALP